MKIPRDISGEKLVGLLHKYGYEKTRQTGSHIRLTTQKNGVHNITIPNHKELRVGTLSSIINDVAEHFGEAKEDILKALF